MGETHSRKWLNHGLPTWLNGNPDFFVTVCGKIRSGTHLVEDARGETLVQSAQFQHARSVWWLHCFLVMPDHVHMLLACHPNKSLALTMEDWKRFTAAKLGARWQKGFFDHRIRSPHDLAEKWQYIVDNPVRAGLVASIEEWPYWFENR